MENLWKMIAKARGLELDEEFMLVHSGRKYKLRVTTQGFNIFVDNQWEETNITDEFIKGEGVIEKIPFRPQVEDSYYTIINENEVIISLWENRSIDYTRLIAGVVFRTREEAKAYVPTWKERISKL